MSDLSLRMNGGLLLTSRAFTVHCGRCGAAWSIPAEQPAFEVQRVQVIDWFAKHECAQSGALLDVPAGDPDLNTRTERTK